MPGFSPLNHFAHQASLREYLTTIANAKSLAVNTQGQIVPADFFNSRFSGISTNRCLLELKIMEILAHGKKWLGAGDIELIKSVAQKAGLVLENKEDFKNHRELRFLIAQIANQAVSHEKSSLKEDAKLCEAFRFRHQSELASEYKQCEQIVRTFAEVIDDEEEAYDASEDLTEGFTSSSQDPEQHDQEAVAPAFIEETPAEISEPITEQIVEKAPEVSAAALLVIPDSPEVTTASSSTSLTPPTRFIANEEIAQPETVVTNIPVSKIRNPVVLKDSLTKSGLSRPTKIALGAVGALAAGAAAYYSLNSFNFWQASSTPEAPNSGLPETEPSLDQCFAHEAPIKNTSYANGTNDTLFDGIDTQNDINQRNLEPKQGPENDPGIGLGAAVIGLGVVMLAVGAAVYKFFKPFGGNRVDNPLNIPDEGPRKNLGKNPVKQVQIPVENPPTGTSIPKKTKKKRQPLTGDSTQVAIVPLPSVGKSLVEDPVHSTDKPDWDLVGFKPKLYSKNKTKESKAIPPVVNKRTLKPLRSRVEPTKTPSVSPHSDTESIHVPNLFEHSETDVEKLIADLRASELHDDSREMFPKQNDSHVVPPFDANEVKAEDSDSSPSSAHTPSPIVTPRSEESSGKNDSDDPTKKEASADLAKTKGSDVKETVVPPFDANEVKAEASDSSSSPAPTPSPTVTSRSEESSRKNASDDPSKFKTSQKPVDAKEPEAEASTSSPSPTQIPSERVSPKSFDEIDKVEVVKIDLSDISVKLKEVKILFEKDMTDPVTMDAEKTELELALENVRNTIGVVVETLKSPHPEKAESILELLEDVVHSMTPRGEGEITKFQERAQSYPLLFLRDPVNENITRAIRMAIKANEYKLALEVRGIGQKEEKLQETTDVMKAELATLETLANSKRIPVNVNKAIGVFAEFATKTEKIILASIIDSVVRCEEVKKPEKLDEAIWMNYTPKLIAEWQSVFELSLNGWAKELDLERGSQDFIFKLISVEQKVAKQPVTKTPTKILVKQKKKDIKITYFSPKKPGQSLDLNEQVENLEKITKGLLSDNTNASASEAFFDKIDEIVDGALQVNGYQIQENSVIPSKNLSESQNMVIQDQLRKVKHCLEQVKNSPMKPEIVINTAESATPDVVVTPADVESKNETEAFSKRAQDFKKLCVSKENVLLTSLKIKIDLLDVQIAKQVGEDSKGYIQQRTTLENQYKGSSLRLSGPVTVNEAKKVLEDYTEEELLIVDGILINCHNMKKFEKPEGVSDELWRLYSPEVRENWANVFLINLKPWKKELNITDIDQLMSKLLSQPEGDKPSVENKIPRKKLLFNDLSQVNLFGNLEGSLLQIAGNKSGPTTQPEERNGEDE